MNRTIVYKKCTKCKETKTLHDNFQFRNDIGNWRNQCNKCRYEAIKKRYNSDPEYRRRANQRTTEWKRQQSATNPEYRARHRNRQVEYSQTPEGILGAFKREAEYRCVGKFVYVPFTYKDLQIRMNLFDGGCAYCDRKVKLVRDHVHPLAWGGHHAIYNILPCCERCNISKGNSFIFHWYPKQPFYSVSRYFKICEISRKPQQTPQGVE